MLRPVFSGTALLASALSCYTQEHSALGAQHETAEIHIHPLNAKTGEPIVGRQIFFDRQARLLSHAEEKDIVTGADGIASATVPPTGYMVDPIVVDLHMCSKGEKNDEGHDHVSRFSIAQILTNGLVAHNSCSKLTRTAVPGELILWARPKSALEKLTD